MNNYLLQLLKEVKTLIIPGLGALTVTNESTGEILFMPYLKFDDGTLAKHIASKENMELNDASNMISKFVREVTAELDKGNSYDMYQFGRFVKVDGEIAFEAWAGSNSEESKTAETPVQEPVIETPKKEEPKVEEKPKEDKIIPPVVETPAKEEKAPLSKTEVSSGKDERPKEETPLSKTEVSSGKDEKPKEEQKPEPKAEKIVPPPVVEAPKATGPKEPVKPAVKKPVKEPKAPKEKKKTSVFAYILWGFLVLILGAGTFVAIQFDSLKKDFPILADLAGENDDVAKGSEDVKQLEEDPGVSGDSATASEPIPEDEVQVVEDQLPAEKPIEESKKTVTPKETPAPKPKTTVTVNKKPVTKTPKTTSTATFDGSKHFHVIAGSFGSEANANKLAGKLQSKGFGEASVTMNNGMYRVSVKGFATLNEATAEAANIQSSVPGAWVLKM